jgi:hypothetical protein
MRTIPEPKNFESGYAYDFLNGTLFQPVKHAFDLPGHVNRIRGKRQEASNVNTLDEVPDSSWFTNRNGRQRMTADEIRRAPNAAVGLAPGLLTVTSGKVIGVQPGFVVRDERRDTYYVKFDPSDYPELASAAEMISTKIFYAIGYNVPENSLLRFSREQLRLDPQARFRDERGGPRQMTEADLDKILSRVPRQSNGLYRALASKRLNRRGNSSFQGVRRDDPNDIIPHEHRRELRGLRVFCAWLAHNDIRAQNTMDVYVSEGGRKFLRHYLVDFGSTLGSGTTGPNLPFANHEYRLDASEIGKTFFSLGMYQQPWRTHPVPTLYSSAGNYSAQGFDPDKWKPEFPLVAFANMTRRDAYWAAKIVASFTDEQIRAAVSAGELSDAEAAEYLAQAIMKRRDVLVRFYLQRSAALDHFQVEQSSDGFLLRFADLREGVPHTGIAGPVIDFELSSVANPRQVLDRGSLRETQFTVPDNLAQRIGSSKGTEQNRGVARLTLRRRGEECAVQVYLYFDPSTQRLRVIGVEHG